MTAQLIQRGQRVPLSTFTSATRLTLAAHLSMPTEVDISVFGLNEDRKLADDRYFIFYNQLSSPEQAIQMDARTQAITIDLTRLPLGIHRLLLAATTDAQPFSTLQRGQATLSADGREVARFEVTGRDFKAECALMLLEIYRHQGAWRIAGVGQGFSGGLQALLESMGGVVDDTPITPPTPAPKTPAPKSASPAPAPVTWKSLASARLATNGPNTCRRCGNTASFLHRLDANGRCGRCAKETQTGLQRFRVRFQAACADGIMELHEWEDLQQVIFFERLEAPEALAFVRPEAVQLLQRTVMLARANGSIEPHEEEEFHRLQRLLEIPNNLVAQATADLNELRAATKVRQGYLPTVKSSLILESGEIPHLELPATYKHITATRSRDIPGRLTLTSKQVHFSGAGSEGGWSIQYGKVLRIEENPNGVSLELGVKKGSGLYQVEKSLMLSATLDALVRLHKRLLLTPQTERASRHIPQDVRIQVWQRDQGKCVQCKDNNYLEFDHIIPFSQGGASTAGNIQLLCRRCNLAKGDRI
ncbi:TerD family protein [Deinococcus sp. KNUC1210]|uniref:TerD family protein n=1 Tax=Deinococcus sp. KNUC1210 TaxID=2917691 RepID=UPI001EF09297|nr:TerD family protein [Deinococcus sp. KNUC1210]ULH16017.1 TerD family protein [Deinococcus sp. KNUC1210]